MSQVKLMVSNLEKLHQWASSKYENYQSLVAIGSFAVGDAWIERRSDYDFLVIFEEYPLTIASDLEIYFKNSRFDETYLFTPLPKSAFIEPQNNSHDFSHKFRSRTIYGRDLIPEVKLPSEEVVKSIYEMGLENTIRKMEIRIAHAMLWDNEKVRDIFWKLFKHSFMNLAIKAYAVSRSYPCTRQDVVNYYVSEELKAALEALNTIDEQSKENIVSVARGLVGYLQVI